MILSGHLFGQNVPTNTFEASNYLSPVGIQVTFKPFVNTVNSERLSTVVGLHIVQSACGVPCQDGRSCFVSSLFSASRAFTASFGESLEGQFSL